MYGDALANIFRGGHTEARNKKDLTSIWLSPCYNFTELKQRKTNPRLNYIRG